MNLLSENKMLTRCDCEKGWQGRSCEIKVLNIYVFILHLLVSHNISIVSSHILTSMITSSSKDEHNPAALVNGEGHYCTKHKVCIIIIFIVVIIITIVIILVLRCSTYLCWLRQPGKSDLSMQQNYI